jgi:hypothetical protein
VSAGSGSGQSITTGWAEGAGTVNNHATSAARQGLLDLLGALDVASIERHTVDGRGLTSRTTGA